MTRLRGNASKRQEEQRENFYARLFDSKEMWAAMRVEGIDDEIAVLRLKFLEHIARNGMQATKELSVIAR